MRLHVLGSGSRGNCFALECNGAVLLLDAGFSAREITRRLDAGGLGGVAIVGIALTHEHGDHAAGALRIARLHRIPIAASAGTWAALGAPPDVSFRALRYGVDVQIGAFRLQGAATSHDAAEPLALGVTLPGGARVGVAYDLGRPTTAVRHLLRGCSALVLEANHDEYLLRVSDYPPVVRQRISGSGGHLSNRAAAELLCELCHDELMLVVLAHLSERCNVATAAVEAIEPPLRAAGFRGTLCIASQCGPCESWDLLPALNSAS